jgi:tRNA threonylcarbamoyladenosine biosynthesis protein TsaB
MAGWLILETSGRSRVGVARDGAVLASVDLGGGRQNNRLLVPTVRHLLATHHIAPTALAGIAAGVGPGSYTGLRVGLAAAKTLAYAVGCPLVAVPSFQAVAAEVPGPVDVIADALQGLIYVQRFADGVPAGELRIVPFDEWAATLTPLSLGGRGVGGEGEITVAGPGVVTFATKLPDDIPRSPVVEPSVGGVYRVAQTLPPLTADELMAVEPLYLRGSSAEEKAKRAGG